MRGRLQAIAAAEDWVFAIVDKDSRASACADHIANAHAFGYYRGDHTLNFILEQMQTQDCGSPFGYDVVGFKVFKVPRDAHEEGNGSAPHGGIKPDDSQADSQDQNDANHSQVQEDEPPPVNSSEVQEDEPPRVKRTKLDAK